MTKNRKRDGSVIDAPELVPQAGDAVSRMIGGTTASTVDRERLAARAYELYLARGGADGQAMDDWLEAERELQQRGTKEGQES